MYWGPFNISIPGPCLTMDNTEFVDPPAKQKAGNIPSAPTKTRRAFVACMVCRDRKIKCVVAQNDTVCHQCKESGNKCIFGKRRMKRRRSVNQTEEVARRFEALESLLSRSQTQIVTGKILNPVPPQDQSGASLSRGANSDSSSTTTFSQPVEDPEDSIVVNKATPQKVVQSGTENSILSRLLLSKTGRLNADAGRLRYFGPTTNLYIYDTYNSLSAPSGLSCAEQEASTMIKGLSGDTHSYILEQYWRFYNSIIEVVPKEPFLQGLCTDDNELYSVFLHLTILSIGLRFVDKERPDVMQLMLSPYESVLHRQAKLLVEPELERGGGLPSIQALLLLSDLECGCGRDVMGWMYAGMACRLFFELGLNVNGISLGLSGWEAEVRQKVSIACIMMDKCWSLFFVRPTCVKKCDLCTEAESSQQSIVYSAAMSLMDIASKVGDSNATRTSGVDASSHMTMLILHGEIERWYKALHSTLRWEQENIQNATAGFFLLHQQYHAIRIMLHRPFANQSSAMNSSPVSNIRTEFAMDSDEVCLESGLQISKVFMASRSRFDIRHSFITAMQHAGTGITALIEVIARTRLPEQRQVPMQHLLYLKSVLYELGHVFQHASRMHRVVDMVLEESGWDAEYQMLRQSVHTEEVAPPAPSTRPDPAVPQNPTSPRSLEKNERNDSVLRPNFGLESTEANALGTFPCDTDSGNNSVDFSFQGALRGIDLTEWLQSGQIE